MTESIFSGDEILIKIQGLLDSAASYADQGLNETADAYRAKADGMMRKYAVEQFQLDEIRRSRGEAPKQEIVTRSMKFGTAHAWQLLNLMNHIVKHNGGRSIVTDKFRHDGYQCYELTFVGYHTDMLYAEMLYTSLYLQMSSEVEPGFNKSAGYDENVYKLHEAGITWIRIRAILEHARLVDGADIPATPWPDGKRMIVAAKRHAAAIGTEYVAKMQPKTYQASFVLAYVERVGKRLAALAETTAPGTALVLVRRSEETDKAYRLAFPQTSKMVVKTGRADAQGMAAGYAAGNRASLTQPNEQVANRSRAISG
jgi:hypothetical protein